MLLLVKSDVNFVQLKKKKEFSITHLETFSPTPFFKTLASYLHANTCRRKTILKNQPVLLVVSVAMFFDRC